ncbi:hypothetical protein, partial [Methanoculleus chikugoensis]|uniref:hypothetical protein n=1 Tax=Methanoculleus chikugoensis TaxID=118126 RepID=UPI001FB50A05
PSRGGQGGQCVAIAGESRASGNEPGGNHPSPASPMQWTVGGDYAPSVLVLLPSASRISPSGGVGGPTGGRGGLAPLPCLHRVCSPV